MNTNWDSLIIPKGTHFHRILNDFGTFGYIFGFFRFNVAITRAQALMVVIGNPYLLSMDKWWKELLKYVLEKGQI